MIIKILISIVVLIMGYLSVLSFLNRHDQLKAPSERQLQPCPNKPNCILSHSSIKREAVEPFAFINNDSQISWLHLARVIEQNGGKIVINDPSYLHAVFTSSIFRFKDDFEVQLNENHIDIRSASRAGKSDLGQNRKRIEKIRTLYQKGPN